MSKRLSLLFWLGAVCCSLWAMMPVDTTEAFTIAPGCDYMAVRWLRDNTDPSSGINSFILRVDATNPNVSFGHRLGKETLLGRERLSHMTQRLNAPLGTDPVCIAAVNGDFFWMENEERENGLLRGFTVQDNEFVLTTDEDRRLGGITEDKLGLVGTHATWTGSVTIGTAIWPLHHINYRREMGELVLFNRYNDRTTRTDSSGTELLLSLLPGEEWHCNTVVRAEVEQIERNIGSMAIPEGKVVLSGSGAMAQVLNEVKIGDVVTTQTTFTLDGVPVNFSQCIGSDQYALILKNGVVETHNFWPGDHPRNAFGYSQSRDTLYFVLVDGRIPESPGCTTSELGEMMRQIGCYSAANWDGGRSAHLWLRQHGFMNQGCDKGKKERAISNGMFIYYHYDHACNTTLDSLLHADPTRAGGNYMGYPFEEHTYSPQPKGYEAFYISHYGRHGSRSRRNSHPYEHLVDWLGQAQAQHNLTAKGEQLLQLAETMLTQFNHMPGRLTDKGEREHTLLAQRMYERHPEVFTKGNGQIRAISSQVPRCLVSMAAFTNQLSRTNPRLRFDMDCGPEIQRIISPASDDKIARVSYVRDSLAALLRDDTTQVYQLLFADPEQMQAVCRPAELQDAVYETVVTAQCFDLYANVYDFMPSQSVYNRELKMAWRLWMLYGNNDLQNATRGDGARYSIRDFITQADHAIHEGTHCADLRFGHDTQLLCLMGAMGVSGVGDYMQPDELEWRWYPYHELPMGSNLQLIFYRPKRQRPAECTDDEILVQVLYNEEEHQLTGLTPVCGNYYRWSDVKAKWNF